MEITSYPRVWNLDSIFRGGSESGQFLDHLNRLEDLLEELKSQVKALLTSLSMNDVSEVARLVEKLGTIRLYVTQANSFITCLIAENPKNQGAVSLRGKVGQLEAHFEKECSKIMDRLINTSDEVWENILETEELKEYKYVLNEWRENAEENLSKEEQNLLSDLMVDGYHAWGHFYTNLVSSINVKIQLDGVEETLSVGQAINLRSHHDEEIRKQAHDVLESTWKEKEDLFSKIINHIVGFRIQVNKKRGIMSAIEDPLKKNRMKEDTLNTMWKVITKNKRPFANYLRRKAELMGDTGMKA